MGRGGRRSANFESRLYLPDGNVQDIDYLPSKEDFSMMGIAMQEAKSALADGNPPVGAVLVTGKKRHGSVFSDHSTEYSDQDLLAHAEINAYRKVRNEFGRDLSSMTAYTTLDPCPMCAHVLVQGNVGKLVVATKYDEVPEFVRPRKLNLDQRLRDAGRTVLLVYGVMNEQAQLLMKQANHTNKLS